MLHDHVPYIQEKRRKKRKKVADFDKLEEEHNDNAWFERRREKKMNTVALIWNFVIA